MGQVQRKKSMLERRLRRALHFQHLVELVDDVPGTVVECGVGVGKSLLVLTNLTADAKRPVWAFDSFEGLPEPAPEDDVANAPREIAEGMLAHGVDEVRDYLRSYGLSGKTIDDRITFAPGYYPESFTAYDGSPIALLHLDVDLYRSYLDCLTFFEPLVAPGGVIAFDEYRSPRWPGATPGIEAHYGGPPPGVQQSPHGNRWFLVKR